MSTDLIKEKNKEYARRFYDKNRERLRLKYRKYYQANKEKAKARSLASYHRNKDTTNPIRNLRLRLKLVQYSKSGRREYAKNRIKTDPSYRIRRNLSSRLYSLIKGLKRGKSIQSILGCSCIELKTYLESKFQPSMTWGNYGVHGWHIDHIKPCSSFDLTNPEQQKNCFHYSNLQPLWCLDNIRKSNKILA